MQQRLERTSEGARQVAIVAASLGRRFSLNAVAAMLGALPASLLQPVDDLLRDSILIERNNTLAFFHDLTYEGVRSSVPVPVRRSLDRQTATVLLERGALPVEVALQLAASAEPGDDIAINTLLRAAEVLSATDPSGAADLSRRALALAPPSHPLRGPLVAGTALWLHAAGRTEEAMTFADTALRQALPPTEEAEVRLSIASMFSVSPEVGADSCRAALALAGLPPELHNRHLALLAHNLSVGGRVSEARELAEQVRNPIDDSGDVRTRFMLELAESGIFYAEGRFSAALSLVDKALISGEMVGDDLTRVMLARQWRCDILMMNDRLDQCLDLTVENVALAQKHLQAWALRVFETGRARYLASAGPPSRCFHASQGPGNRRFRSRDNEHTRRCGADNSGSRRHPYGRRRVEEGRQPDRTSNVGRRHKVSLLPRHLDPCIGRPGQRELSRRTLMAVRAR